MSDAPRHARLSLGTGRIVSRFHVGKIRHPLAALDVIDLNRDLQKLGQQRRDVVARTVGNVEVVRHRVQHRNHVLVAVLSKKLELCALACEIELVRSEPYLSRHNHESAQTIS